MSKVSTEEGYRDYLESLDTKKQSIGKVKNILKGNYSKFDIEEITFFEDGRVLFSGSPKQFTKDISESLYLYELRKRIENSEAYKCMNFNNRKLFIFI